MDAATSVATFAEAVLGRPLWPHQSDALTSRARYRIIAAGRQCGKSVLLATAALFEAATRRNCTILLVSAGEVASRRLLAECAALATGSPLLGGVLDESRSELRLSNGSRILSVPASERQIRGWPVDLLILDEAGFIDAGIWRAAEPAIIARPGSRVILASSPWGAPEHFFRTLWQRGMDSPDEHVASWHWPSTVSPLVDAALLEQIRQRESEDYFRREFLAEWPDAAGAYFGEDELMAAVADYAITRPEDLPTLPEDEPGFPVSAGVDWGLHVDASALCLIGLIGHPLDGQARLFIPWIESDRQPFDLFINRVVDVGQHYWLRCVASERNGIGEFPTTELRDRAWKRRINAHVAPVWTDARRKQSGFGRIKGLMASGRFVLPLYPPLLKELRALEFEQLPSGGLRIAVPERSGHDDLAMALLQAVSCWDMSMIHNSEAPLGLGEARKVVTSGLGLPIPRQPFPDRQQIAPIRTPRGQDVSDGW